MRLALALTLALAWPAAAQQDETLADIRQQLSVLQVEMQKLRGELNTTGGPSVSVGGSTVLDRVNAIESELQRLTQAAERMEFRIESVSRDGSARIEDLRFQLCELTEDCDLAELPNPGPLGAETATEGGETTEGADTDTAASGAITPAAPAPEGDGAELAVGEQADFDRAKTLLDAGDNAAAAEAFGKFLSTYPTGPLSTDAQFHRAQALARAGKNADAARAYLETFSGTPEGPRAPEALVGLGQALAALDQTDEACLTLAEVVIRFPDSPTVAQANSARAGLNCQ
ncbi:tol-pal system protein YbgF [Jannaschia sp. S6380]|uniref:tol-pal system protein YbgF n=1 Tax=Jannaschia sp. S6380 TaxID=2926408 RepID=UPI001FF235E8|nr:tol-pal system protein YbgF [Jannaschia sp. S6380]MCK0169254.1 tol-pal system protein YbgF [Jannaschia sp. S6380]